MEKNSLTSRIVRSETFMNGVASLLAVVMAFVVAGILILAFITTYSVNPESLAKMRTHGVPDALLEKIDKFRPRTLPKEKAWTRRLSRPLVKRITRSMAR
jgi:hypothetical protein